MFVVVFVGCCCFLPLLLLLLLSAAAAAADVVVVVVVVEVKFGGDTAIFLIAQHLLTYVAPPFQFPPKFITKTFKSYTIGAELKGDAVAANKYENDQNFLRKSFMSCLFICKNKN